MQPSCSSRYVTFAHLRHAILNNDISGITKYEHCCSTLHSLDGTYTRLVLSIGVFDVSLKSGVLDSMYLRPMHSLMYIMPVQTAPYFSCKSNPRRWDSGLCALIIGCALINFWFRWDIQLAIVNFLTSPPTTVPQTCNSPYTPISLEILLV